MENRLIFFANETAENVEAPKSETGTDDLKDAAADLAQLEKLKAKPGGTKSASEARGLIDNPNTSDFVKESLKKKIGEVESAASERDNKLTPETTDKLNKTVAALEKSVKFQKGRISENASANSEFGRMASLGNSQELFKDIKISTESISKGSVDLTFAKFNSVEGFKKLGLDQKKELLKAMSKELLANPAATTATLEKFSKDSRLPDKWQKYAEKPDPDSKEHAAKWLLENADKKILQAETAVKFMEGKQDLLTKAGERMPSRDEIFSKSTSEFNNYIESVKSKIASVDAEQAIHFEGLKVSEGEKIQTTEIQNTAAIEKAESEKTAQAEELTPKLQKFIEEQGLGKEATAREEKIKAAGKEETETADKVTNLRQQAQAGESVGLAAKMKNFFKKKENKTDENTENSEKNPNEVSEKGEPKKEESFAERARREIAKETLDDPKTSEIFSKSLGLKTLNDQDAAKLSGLLSLEKTDAESVRGKLTPEIKAILAQQAADDYEKKAA
jgi:hypothetical protein